MFDLSTSHLVQLLIASIAGISLFVFSYIGYQRFFFKALIILIPFQFIDSIYGSFNMAATYMLGISMFLNRSWLKKKAEDNWPLILPFFMIGLVFFLSWTQSPRIFWSKTIFYMIMLGSNIFLFYMTYHIISSREDFINFFNLLIFCNILVILYCFFQFVIGFQEYNVLGIGEFRIQQNLEEKLRIVGPFNAVGITAEYFVIQCIILAYYVLISGKYKKLALILIFCNTALLIGTGNRGGFISFLLSIVLFAYFFRKSLGVGRTLLLLIASFFILITSSFLMVKYTDFNVLYERLLGTQMEGLTPDTRSGWSFVLEKIVEKPVLGHGPRLVTTIDYDRLIKWPKDEIGFWPHNLYLYILYTTGMIGFIAYSILGLSYLRILGKLKLILNENDDFLSGLPKLGIIIFIVFLFDQMKVEFLRPSLLDYQHYLFALSGMFCALKKAT